MPVIFHSPFRELEVLFPKDRFGTVNDVDDLYDQYGHLMIDRSGQPMKKQKGIASITFNDGRIVLADDDPYVERLRNHLGNEKKGGSDFAELAPGIQQLVEAMDGRILFVIPDKLSDQDIERLEQMERYSTGNIPPALLEPTGIMLGKLIETFQARNIHVPPPERGVRVLRSTIVLFMDALEEGGVKWQGAPPDERRTSTGGGQAANA